MYRTSQRDPLPPRPRISAFDAREFLHQTDGGVAGFCEGELLANADSGSAVEG